MPDISPDITDLLLKVQSKVSNVHKDGRNPHFKSKYSTIESVIETLKPILNEVGLGVIQPAVTGSQPGTVAVETTLYTKEGASHTWKLEMSPVQNNPQAAGSVITYLRRYMLVSLFFLVQDDDDGNASSIKQPEAKQNLAPLLNELLALAEEKGISKSDIQKAVVALGKQSLSQCSMADLMTLINRVRAAKV